MVTVYPINDPYRQSCKKLLQITAITLTENPQVSLHLTPQKQITNLFTLLTNHWNDTDQ